MRYPPSATNVWVNLQLLHYLCDASHLVAKALRVREHVVALLEMNARHAISALVSRAGLWATTVTTHSKLACKRRARGVSGLVIVSQALGMSTSRMALRVTFFRLDLEPRVATSLRTV